MMKSYPSMSSQEPVNTVRLVHHTICGENEFLTYYLSFPKVLLAQLNKHRLLVNSVASSRAINSKKRRDDVRFNPFIPTFTKEQKGMSGLVFTPEELTENEGIYETWNTAIECMLVASEELEEAGVHKQNANRLLDTFTLCSVVISGSDWDNFFELRCNEETVDLDFCKIAEKMQLLKRESTPKELKIGQPHIPVFKGVEDVTDLRLIIARIARTSFDKTEGTFTTEQDLSLFYRLLKNKHAAPFEHVALAVSDYPLEASVIVNNTEYSLPKLAASRLAVYDGELISTRQYRGFYTVRAMLEDGYSIEEIQYIYNKGKTL